MRIHGFGIPSLVKGWLADRNISYGKDSSFITRCRLTTRYRLAAAGMPITANEKKLLSYKNKHKGERVFIIGNGPSLNKLDLTLLKNEYTIGVNGIFLNYEKMGFYPTYYVVEDRLVAEDRAVEINKLQGIPKFFGNYLNYCLQSSQDVIWMNLVVNYRDYPDFPNFSTNALRKLWVGGTVSYVNLQLAYYMGFEQVYLIGFDHNYIIPNTVIWKNGMIQSTEDDPNHFNSNYFGKGYRWNDPNVERMEKALIKAKKYFEADNRKVLNATAGGHLEVFERVEYNSLFK